jgi:hypothetical protein
MTNFNIDKNLLDASIKKAQEIFDMSMRLRDDNTKVVYQQRRPSFVPLVSEAGYTEFHPLVTVNVAGTFRELFWPIIRRLRDNYYMSETDDEARKWHDLYRLADLFNVHLTNEDIINGTIPSFVREFINSRGLKGFSSPKLSRALSKLADESSPFWAWYTNKCPKKLMKGENKDFKVVVSVLPHHIAGMSYFSCYNSGGKRWNGWEGTSCQDPTRNSAGVAMYNLPASVKDESLAIAYVTKAENNDILNPVMEARALVRVVELSNGNVFYVVLRQFGYPESITILLDGLKNRFSNVFVNHDIREKYDNSRGKCLRIHMNIEDCRNFAREETCGCCEGRGHDEDGDDCLICDGRGRVGGQAFLPYNDDSDIWGIDEDTGTKITYRIPKQMLIDYGLYSVEETAHDEQKTA